MRVSRLLASVALALVALLSLSVVAFDRSALGLVVAACRVNATLLSTPKPCLSVEDRPGTDAGYAVLKEPGTRQRTILAALADVPGIEDPRLLGPDAPNFFADAWRMRALVPGEASEARGREGFALAINPQMARTQDRLHVHMACFRPRFQRLLAQRVGTVNPHRFAPMNFRFDNHPLWAMRVAANDLKGINPLQLLADRMPGARLTMDRHMLIVVSERLPSGQPVFVLMTNNVAPNFRWLMSVEAFLDYGCSG